MIYRIEEGPEHGDINGDEKSKEFNRQQKERKRQKLELEKVLMAVKDVQKMTIHSEGVKSDLAIFENVWAKLIDRFDAGEVEFKKGVK